MHTAKQWNDLEVNFLSGKQVEKHEPSKQSKFTANVARSMVHALKTFYCRGAMNTRVNPDLYHRMRVDEALRHVLSKLRKRVNLVTLEYCQEH